jgi:site-specific DNA-methyltransferase (adenine-specific)
VGKAIDKAALIQSGIDTPAAGTGDHVGTVDFGMKNRCGSCGKAFFSGSPCTCPRRPAEYATEDAARWDGWGTALKPGHEPIVLARKPLAGSVVANVLEHGTGALNVAGCQVATDDDLNGGAYSSDGNRNAAWDGTGMLAAGAKVDGEFEQPDGRWPPNVLLTHAAGCEPVGTRQVRGEKSRTLNRNGQRQMDGWGLAAPSTGVVHGGPDGVETVEAWECVAGCPVAELDRQTGDLGVSRGGNSNAGSGAFRFGADEQRIGKPCGLGDTGGGSRFYPVTSWEPGDLEFAFAYHAKAGSAERPRDGDDAHPTVKPLGLMLWLVKLITPPGGLVVDPFAGTAPTLEAAAMLNMRGIGGDNWDRAIRLAKIRLTDLGGRDRRIRARRPRKVPDGVEALF